MQWSKEKGQKVKQLSTKQYTENYKQSNTNPIKHGSKLMCSGRVFSSSATSIIRRFTLVMSYAPKTLNYLAFQSFDFERTR